MRRRRVKITGIGPVTPAGIGREAFWNGILASVSRVRPYTKLGDEFGPLVAAEVLDFDVERYVDRALMPKAPARHTLFAMAGTMLALQDAGLSREELAEANCALVVGASLVDFGGIGNAIDAVARRGARAAQARVVYTSPLASITDAINHMLGLSASVMSLQSSCCAGLDAIGFAANMVATGEADIAICGGTEAPLHKFPLMEFRAAGLTPPTADMPERLARPFDLWRTTGVVSEGACMFVIEPETSPRRGYSYISGYAFANDTPDYICGGMVGAAKMAMAGAGLRPNDIDSINAWGPGHRVIDAGESKAMEDVFGKRLHDVPVFSIKGAVGSALGAAPAIQVAASALGQQQGAIPPTVNWHYPDPSCPLQLNNRPMQVTHGRTLINAHGVGKVNAAMILERC